MLYNLFTSNFSMIKHKKFLIGSGITCLFLAFFLMITCDVLEKLDSNSYIAKSLNENPSLYNDSDVIVIGDSRANQGVDSTVLENFLQASGKENLKVYNLGRPGLQTPFIYFVFADYLHKVKKKPKVLLMNISFYLLGGMQWMDDIYFSYYKPDLWQVIHAYQNKLVTFSKGIKWYFGTRIPFIRYRNKLKTGILELLASSPEKIFTTYSDIYLFRKYQLDAANKGYLSNGSKSLDEKSMNISGFDSFKKGVEAGYTYITYLKNLFDLAARYKVHIVIYEFPWPIVAKNDAFIEILNYYQNLLKEAAGNNSYIHFIDYPYFWEADKFIDPLHLNQFGADELSKLATDWVKPYI